jgi:hypothetical protein
MIRYHDSPRHYEDQASHRSAEQLRTYLRDYTSKSSCRKYLNTDLDGQDHRAWRRAVIQEALRRGLIDKDPGDAP